MWKTWKTGFIVAGAGLWVWKPILLPVESGMINPAAFHIPPSGRPDPAGRGYRMVVFFAAWEREGNACRDGLSIHISTQTKGFPAIGYKNPSAGFGRDRREKNSFPWFPQHVEKTAFENQSLVFAPLRRLSPHSCHNQSTDMGQIRPERSACGSGRPWR